MHAPTPPRNASAPASPGALAYLAVLVANVSLAFGPWFVRLADVGPIAAGFWRLALALPFLAALTLGSGGGRGGVRVDRGLAAALVAGGIAFAADLGSWHLGILRTTLANATLFGNSAILMFPIWGFLAARAWPTRSQALALLLAAIGAGLLMGRSAELDHRHLAGDLLCLLAGVLYTVYFILMARARAALAPMPALLAATAAGVAPLLLFALAAGERVWPDAWQPLVLLALVSQVSGQGCMTYALGRLPPLVIGLALLLQPVVAGAIGWIVYGERLGPPELTGAVLVAIALVLVRRAPRLAAGRATPDVAPEETA